MLEITESEIKHDIKLKPEESQTKDYALGFFKLNMATSHRFDFSIVDSNGKKLYSNLMSGHLE